MLSPSVRVVYPFRLSPYRRFVAAKEEIVRRACFLRSLSQTLARIRRQMPQIFEDKNLIRYFLERFNSRGKDQFLTGKRLQVTDFNVNWGWKEGPEAVRILNDAVKGGKIEFLLINSKIEAKGRRTGIDDEHEMDFRNAWPLMINFEIMNRGLPDIIYRESDICRIMVKIFGNISWANVIDRLTNIDSLPNNPFLEVMRPTDRACRESLYVIRRDKPAALPGTVLVFNTGVNGYTVALKREIREIEKEGRVVPVHLDDKTLCYFAADLFAVWREKGDITEGEIGRERRYVLTNKLGALLAQGKMELPHKILPGASEAYLKFYESKKLTQAEKHAYPLLAAAIDILRASPRGTEKYFEAARIAAEKQAGEDSLAELLLQDIPSDKPEHWLCYWGCLPEAVRDYIRDFYRSLGSPQFMWEISFKELESGISKLRQAKGIGFKSRKNMTAKDIQEIFRQYFKALGESAMRGEGQLAYFATKLAELRCIRNERISREQEREYRVIIAPLAERCGFSDLAALIRNEIFRLNYRRAYQRAQKEVEVALGLSYVEAQLHLQVTADLIHEALIKAGIGKDDYKIAIRVKSPYSVWEKLQAIKAKLEIKEVSPALLHDLLGISVTVENDRTTYRISAVIQEVLPILAPDNFNDKHGLLPFMDRRGSPIYSDEIKHEKESGYSAITMMRVTELGLPVEVQIASTARNKRNYSGKAAHWKLKFKREAEHFYPEIKGKELGDLSEFDGI